MLRINHSFLAYIETLYEQQYRKENIIIKEFSKGERIFYQNETTSKIMFIKSGITKCFFVEQNDKEYILEFLSKGEIIGEIEFIKKINCLCNIEAVTDVTAYSISIDYFAELLKKDIQLNSYLLNVFAERIINTSSRASFQQLYTIEHSLSKIIEMQSKQEIKISKEDIASYLGISLRSLNRTIKNLSNK